jgi:hypothetical protein
MRGVKTLLGLFGRQLSVNNDPECSHGNDIEDDSLPAFEMIVPGAPRYNCR